MNDHPDWLPDLLLLKDHGGDWERYEDALYAVFRRDFLLSRPTFRGNALGLKRHPLFKNREATFWHFISEGKVEDDRTPDLRRCERIAWPRAVIEAVDSGRVSCWEQTRKGERRFILAIEDFGYIVILAERRGYLLPWTAFCVEHEHRRRKFRKDFVKWRS